MPDLIAIGQGLNAVKALTDITKNMLAVRETAKALDITVELNRKALDVQIALQSALSEQSALVETIDDLKKQIARLKTWDREKKRYGLVELPPGVLVRRLKESAAQSGEPIHSICATCYDKDQKSVVQADQPVEGVYNLTYNACGAKLAVGNRQSRPVPYRSGSGWTV